MISGGWAVVLTVIFVGTGLYSLWHWSSVAVARRAAQRRPEWLTGLSHLVMSAAMIVMVWWPAGLVGTVVQVVVFVAFAVAFVQAGVRASDAADRVGAVAPHDHERGDGLDAGHHAAADGWYDSDRRQRWRSRHHGSVASADPAAPGHGAAPVWVVAVNWVWIALLVAAAGWWIVRLIRERRKPGGAWCHSVMAVAMALMLAVMG